MRNLRRALLSGGLGFAVSLIAACGGGSGLLSGNQASTLNSRVNQVSSALNAGDCGAVQGATQNLVSAIAGLPATVSPTLKQDLDNAASQVSQLAVQQCHPATSVTTTPKATTSTPTTTTTTTTTTTPTTPTTQTNTTPTTTTPATTTTTPGNNGGSSGGGGLSGGSGGGATGGTTGGAGGSGGSGPGGGNGNGNGQ
jgi:hypothetical protein